MHLKWNHIINRLPPLIILLLGAALTTGFFVVQTGYKLALPPQFNKGTFWKSVDVQLSTHSGQVLDPVSPIHMSCYIDGETSYKGRPVYEATLIIEEEHKMSKVFIQKENLTVFDAIVIGRKSKDTLSLEFELLNFPLFKGKKWESISTYQEFPGKPIQKTKTRFEIIAVKDSVLQVQNQRIKSKAFYIYATFTAEGKEFQTNYTYLAPKGNFPGTCPIFMWHQSFDNARQNGSELLIKRRHDLMNYNW